MRGTGVQERPGSLKSGRGRAVSHKDEDVGQIRRLGSGVQGDPGEASGKVENRGWGAARLAEKLMAKAGLNPAPPITSQGIKKYPFIASQ